MKAEIECGVPDEGKREGPNRTVLRTVYVRTVYVRTVYVRTVYVRRVVEREGVIKSLTVRNLMSPGAEGGCRKASVHAAAFSHLCHVEPRSGWVGYRRGEETAPCLAVRAREAGARARLASAGRSADAPAGGQAVGANRARTKLDLGRGRWRGGGSERMNGQAKDLSDRNTFFICDAVNADRELRKIFAYSR